MDPKNLETAERFAKKRRELSEMLELLSNYVNSAFVYVEMKGYSPPKKASIQSDTFNALICKLIESEIKNIDDFVEKL